MNSQIKQNFEEKIRLILIEYESSLDSDFQAMLRRHSADGLLRSGNTIKSTMDMISRSTSELYKEILSYIDIVNPKYDSSIESEVLRLAKDAHSKFRISALVKFKKSTEVAGKPDLYERLLPDLESEMNNHHAVFQNELDAKVIDLKLNTTKSPIEKFLWVVEVSLILASMFISGMWFKDPGGNYEPVLVGLGLVAPLIYLFIKRLGKQ